MKQKLMQQLLSEIWSTSYRDQPGQSGVFLLECCGLYLFGQEVKLMNCRGGLPAARDSGNGQSQHQKEAKYDTSQAEMYGRAQLP